MPLNMVLLDLLGVWLVLVQSGPLCPHAHSILIFLSPFPLVRVFIDVSTVLLTGTDWLGHPSFNIWGS
jgi:hypothetical protein